MQPAKPMCVTTESRAVLNNYFIFTGREFHQYDSVAYPHIVEPSGLIQRSWHIITGARGFSQMQEILDQPSMQSEALRIYLKEHKERLCDLASLDAEMATRDILHIFHSLRYVRICDRNYFKC